jgi:hypothetical protein
MISIIKRARGCSQAAAQDGPGRRQRQGYSVGMDTAIVGVGERKRDCSQAAA